MTSRNSAGGGRQREAGPERENGQREEAATAPGPGPPPPVPPCALRTALVPGYPCPRRSSQDREFREAGQGPGTEGPGSTPSAPGWLQPPGGTVPGGTDRGPLTALPTRAQRAGTPKTPGLSPGADTGGYGKGRYQPGTEVCRVGTRRNHGSTGVVPEGTGWEAVGATGGHRGRSRSGTEGYRDGTGGYEGVPAWHRRALRSSRSLPLTLRPPAGPGRLRTG